MFWIWFFGIIGIITLIDWLTYKYIKGNGYRDNEFRIRDGFTIYSGPHNIGFKFEPDYDEADHMQLIASTMWHQFFVHIPWWKAPKVTSYCSDNYSFGFYLYNDNSKKLFHSIWLLWRNKSKVINMPWSCECHHTIIEGKNNQRYIEFSGEHRERYKKAKKWNAKPLPVKDQWDYYRSNKFSWEAPYKYITKDGREQKTTALYHIEDREWRPRWFMWCGLFKHTQRTLDIELMDEMGEQVGSWKGGVTAFGRRINPGEDPHEAYQRIMKTEVLD